MADFGASVEKRQFVVTPKREVNAFVVCPGRILGIHSLGFFFWDFFRDCLSCFTPAKITFTSILSKDSRVRVFLIFFILSKFVTSASPELQTN